MIEQAKGKNLDRIGELSGVTKNKFLFIFKESDKKYRKRILNLLKYWKLIK